MKKYDNDNIEKIFNQDSRNKKRIGSNVSKRASRRGYIRGGVRTQSDFLSTKEKKKLNGEVKVSELYKTTNDIPDLEEILKMREESITKILKTLKGKFTYLELAKRWNTTKSKLQQYFYRYSVYDKITLVPQGKRQYKMDKDILEMGGVPSFNDISNMDESTQKLILRYTQIITSRNRVAKYWGISDTYLKRVYIDMEIDKVSGVSNRKDLENELIKRGYLKTKIIKETPKKDTNKDLSSPIGELVGMNEEQFKKIQDIILDRKENPAEFIEETRVTDKEVKKDDDKNIEEVNTNNNILNVAKENKVEVVSREFVEDYNREVLNPKKNYKYSGMNYSLSGLYTKEEFKELVPPTCGILIKDKKYEVIFEIREIVE